MSSFAFWNQWSKEYRLTWYVLAFIFALSIVFLWYGYIQGPDGVIQWQTLQEQKVIDSQVHSFRLGPFQLNIPGESYVILEFFQGSNVEPNLNASYFSLIILAISAVILVSVITTAEKFWFFIGMGVFVLFMISLRFEVLDLFSVPGEAMNAILIVLYLIPAYYFSQVRPATPFLIRVAAFLILTFLLALSVYFFSNVDYPFFHLYLTSYTPGLIFTGLFIILVAHEIIAGFVYMVNYSPSKSLRHFIIISLIYLVNISITLLHETGAIDWNFVYINLYLLLTLSAVLSIWGFRKREPLYSNIIAFNPFGAFFLLALGAIAFTTIGQFLHNANDPALRVVRDAIIYSHAGYGLVFLMYILSNFGVLLYENRPAYKVLYNPARMPYFSYRLAGLVATLCFIFYANWKLYVYHGTAGFYNTAGDMHTLLGNDTNAKAFYEQARRQSARNHRSNYILGNLNQQNNNFTTAQQNFEWANGLRPTEYSLTNAGNLFLWQNDVFGAVKAYKESLTKMPDSYILANNAGVAYTKIHNLDSATLYLSKAREGTLVRNAAEANFFALAAMEMLPINPDSIIGVFDTKATNTLSNALALSTLLKVPLNSVVDPLGNKQLDLYTATYLNNYIIKNAKQLDTTFIAKAFVIASSEINSNFSEALKASLAHAYYHQGNISKALEILAEQVFISQSYQGKFNYIMGLWALEQNNPELAASYFAYADTYEYKQARFYHAIALTEAGKTTVALNAWDSVAVNGDDGQKNIASRIRTILTVPTTEAVKLPDAYKYQFCRYRIGLADSVFFNRLSNTFENSNYEAQALLDLSQRYFEAGLLKPSIHYYNRIAGLKMTDKTLYEDVRHFELRLLAYRKELNSLASQINKGIEFQGGRGLEKIYYTALINEGSGDLVNAAKNYRILATYNPYFEEGILAAYAFFRNNTKEQFYPYSILAEAIQINSNSLRLLKAYRDEALRVGLDEYASSVAIRIAELENQ